jgi:hypothetical protein
MIYFTNSSTRISSSFELKYCFSSQLSLSHLVIRNRFSFNGLMVGNNGNGVQKKKRSTERIKYADDKCSGIYKMGKKFIKNRDNLI